MNLSDDCELTYIVNHESWYYESNRRSGLFDEGNGRSLNIQSSHAGGGCDWEFSVVEHTFNGHSTAIKVCMFSDSFSAWTEIPELFQRLRHDHPNTLDQVRRILDDIGGRDETKRVDRHQLVREVERARSALDAYDASRAPA